MSACVTLVIIDVDRFKRVNDTYGHLVGDEVLRAIARLMAAALADLGQLGRLGGEEFVLVSCLMNREEIARRLESFRRPSLRKPWRSDLQLYDFRWGGAGAIRPRLRATLCGG